MNYVIGDWAVKSLTTDTIATAKNISVTDLKYSTDFKRTVDEPAEAKVVNITSANILSPEELRFGRKTIKNVYLNSNIDVSAQLPEKQGVQVMAELKFHLQATNSVSGLEADLPFTVRTVLYTPASSVVTSDAIKYALLRGVASCFATGSTNETRFVELIKGSLLPS